MHLTPTTFQWSLNTIYLSSHTTGWHLQFLTWFRDFWTDDRQTHHSQTWAPDMGARQTCYWYIRGFKYVLTILAFSADNLKMPLIPGNKKILLAIIIPTDTFGIPYFSEPEVETFVTMYNACSQSWLHNQELWGKTFIYPPTFSMLCQVSINSFIFCWYSEPNPVMYPIGLSLPELYAVRN